VPEEVELRPIIVTKELDSLASGGTDTAEFKFSKPYKVKAILFNRDDGQPWTGSLCTVQVGREYLTDGSTPVSVFGTDWMTRLPLDITLPANVEMKVALTNGEGTTITAYVTAVLEPME